MACFKGITETAMPKYRGLADLHQLLCATEVIIGAARQDASISAAKLQAAITELDNSPIGMRIQEGLKGGGGRLDGGR